MAYLPRFIRRTVLATLSCGLFLMLTAPAAPAALVSSSPRPAAVSPAPVAAAPVSAADSQGTSQGVPGWIWGGLVALVMIGVTVWFRSSRRSRPGTTE
ncbi:hypothetical protein [Streptosporangium sp. NPDC087985]|uniref:hypothetical protein n=1 Tax=Streptosporangium sp. NPDC087985 TaxID=3366196 RepID=UPI003817A067